MGFLVCLLGILVGAYADEAWLKSRLPKLENALAAGSSWMADLGLVAAVLGALAILRSVVGFLGLLGLPYSTLNMVFWVWYLGVSLALVAVGVMFGTERVNHLINDSRKEATVLALRDRLMARRAPLGRLLWGGSLGLLVLMFAV